MLAHKVQAVSCCYVWCIMNVLKLEAKRKAILLLIVRLNLIFNINQVPVTHMRPQARFLYLHVPHARCKQ